ncbi:(d)CMP kinase [Alkalihalobacterium chitinilyticum]|uniref:Cytidylate kinase n=1 Tax=Alkalihalobacterium chitinilyticum TaxID=2980103 RepID=A0ABT5V9D6_9BACI|nr:(d)CMP kinase [Alkalihalobacterium chitinilyticum]MDE5411947.1 (d)CMP kinase [Alkalihalobacterium chitinilyticum]
MKRKSNIAIDGPAGAGKSTVAKMVAEELSYLYIDTGAMYRALTYCALKRSIDPKDGRQLRELLDKISIILKPTSSGTLVYVNETEVTEEIRSSEVTNTVSIIASHEDVRLEMVKQQQKMAENGGTVMDGRDIGTHVLPQAEVKVFLTASVEERAKRRHEENIQKGFSSDLEQLKEEIARRDDLDSNREFAPLQQAFDAVVIDSTHMSIPEVVENILHLVEERF